MVLLIALFTSLVDLLRSEKDGLWRVKSEHLSTGPVQHGVQLMLRVPGAAEGLERCSKDNTRHSNQKGMAINIVNIGGLLYIGGLYYIKAAPILLVLHSGRKDRD